MLIKPVSGSCDLRCAYCFYRDKNHGVMSCSTLEIIVKKALAFSDESCSFMFQGGEPTIAGLPFFQKLVEYQQRYNSKHVKIHNAIQTNGIAIDEKWAKFFAENDFLAGLSLDGPQEIHDKNRRDARGNGTFQRVMNAAKLFQRFNVNFNILCVVNKHNAAHGKRLYRFFKDNNFRYLQFIPCLEPEKPGKSDFSLTPEGYSDFLTSTFDEWHRDFKRGDGVSIRYFDNLLGVALGYPPEACGMSGVCGCQFVTEADGSVYPCDFYVEDEWKIGNILRHSFEEMRFSPTCEKFIDQSRNLHPDCKVCRWFSMCRGGCRRERDERGKNIYCGGMGGFFEFICGRGFLHRVNMT
ncbi:MAG: anaerobic sulfatase maturase [Oscillospiraceae bacterium]|nr:anaerobic sulfatase maturase [Oscillospiraceae bacterium]